MADFLNQLFPFGAPEVPDLETISPLGPLGPRRGSAPTAQPLPPPRKKIVEPPKQAKVPETLEQAARSAGPMLGPEPGPEPPPPPPQSHIRFSSMGGPMQELEDTIQGSESPDAAYRRYVEGTFGLEEAAKRAQLSAMTDSYSQGIFPEYANRYRPEYRSVHTVDADGNPITKIMPASEAVGQEFRKAPPTAMIQQQQQYRKAAPIISAVGELSEKINTAQGMLAKITGTAERAKAELNLNDDLSEYNALVSGFTPLVARALGHSGVLTEQDVVSVRELFPKPTDSKNIRDRKMARIHSILGAIQEVGSSFGMQSEGQPSAAPSQGAPVEATPGQPRSYRTAKGNSVEIIG